MNDREQRRDGVGRLLAEPAVEDVEVAEFLQSFRGHITTVGSDDQRHRHLDIIRATVAGQQTASRRPPLRDRVRAVLGMTTAKVALAGAVAAAATGGAVTGSLPAPIQQAVAEVAGAVGIQLPRPADTRPAAGSDPVPSGDGHPTAGTGQHHRAGEPGGPPAGQTASDRSGASHGEPTRQGNDGEAGGLRPGDSQAGPPTEAPAETEREGAARPDPAQTPSSGARRDNEADSGQQPAAPGPGAGAPTDDSGTDGQHTLPALPQAGGGGPEAVDQSIP